MPDTNEQLRNEVHRLQKGGWFLLGFLAGGGLVGVILGTILILALGWTAY